jgi:hypothetical protein
MLASCLIGCMAQVGRKLQIVQLHEYKSRGVESTIFLGQWSFEEIIGRKKWGAFYMIIRLRRYQVCFPSKVFKDFARSANLGRFWKRSDKRRTAELILPTSRWTYLPTSERVFHFHGGTLFHCRNRYSFRLPLTQI